MTTIDIESLLQTKHISHDIEVHSGFAKCLGDNGKEADASVSCWAAPEVRKYEVWVYLTTNGDPVPVGWIDFDGELELDEDTDDWIGHESMAWLREILSSELLYEFDTNPDFTDESVFEGVIQWREGDREFKASDQGNGIYHIAKLTDGAWIQTGIVRIPKDRKATPRVLSGLLAEADDDDRPQRWGGF